jgi:hypothetical protein
MQVLRPPIVFSLFMSNTLLWILLAKVLSIIQARSQKGGGSCCHTAAPPQIEFLKTQILQKLWCHTFTWFTLDRNQTQKSADDLYMKNTNN